MIPNKGIDSLCTIMVLFPVFATLHLRSASSLPHPPVWGLARRGRGELCVKTRPSVDSHSYTSPETSAKPRPINYFQIKALHTLPFSVSCKSFVCRSYENNRGVYQLFPFWNSSLALYNVRASVLSFFSLFHSTFHRSYFPTHKRSSGNPISASSFRRPILIPDLPSPNTFRINTYKSDTKQTTLTVFRINTYEKHGGGGPRVTLFRSLRWRARSRSRRMRRGASGRVPWRQASKLLCGRVWPGG
jgi:hypothetical protein